MSVSVPITVITIGIVFMIYHNRNNNNCILGFNYTINGLGYDKDKPTKEGYQWAIDGRLMEYLLNGSMGVNRFYYFPIHWFDPER